jgi:hypothetical protein
LRRGTGPGPAEPNPLHFLRHPLASPRRRASFVARQ